MSTDKLNNEQGTARMDAGTDRMDAGTARMDGSQGASQTGGGTIFAEGQTIVLNGNNCVIESLISMGSGEAVVYKIKRDGKHYALKHYKPNMPLSDTAKKVLAKIRDNPKDRVVRIFDFGNYLGQDFEIMEYAEGGTLGEYIKKNGPIRDTRLKDIVKQINEGLQQLHGYYKIIYQDLKPENVFFKDSTRLQLVLADFGISSVMHDDNEEVEVIASNTDLYAAPELARKGNRTEVIVTPAVDYFALGITMYELWLGEQPFKDIKATTRERRIQNKDVDFNIHLPDDCKALIQGLIDPLPRDRMGNEHVQKWLKGDPLTLDNQKSITVTSTVYEPLKFGNEFATNPKELAALMQKYPKEGKVCLYNDFITSTLKKAGDVVMYSDIQNVISQYGKDQDAGLIAAIYTLDPERPFISRTGNVCKSSEEIADALISDSAHYMDELNKPNASLYIYITITGGSQGKETADTFCNFFKEYPPNRALTLVYLKLQSDNGITIGSKRYISADELKQEKDSAQIELIKKAVMKKDSQLLVWLSDMYNDYLKSTEEFGKQNIPDQFFLLGLLPFLSFRELTGSNGETALQDLIDNYTGRADLFEAYVSQGLPLKGVNIGLSIKKTPIDYIVYNFSNLCNKHGTDTVFNLIRLLYKLGADINERSNDGSCPFINSLAKDDKLVKLLLELGADGDFISEGGKICKSGEDIADAIMAESYYLSGLKNPNDNLFLYLIATGSTQGKEFADKFRQFFREYSPKHALALMYIHLQSDLGITIGSKRYKSIDELKQEKDGTQIDLVKKAILEKDSLLLVWITVQESNFKSTEAFNNLTIPDQFFLLGLFPFLSYKELKSSNWENSALSDLRFLIDFVPWRSELFEVYAYQGLPLKGKILDTIQKENSPVKRTPLDYIVFNYNELGKHGIGHIDNLIRLFCKLGADINEYSSDGTCPLINAFEAFLTGENDLVKLLLELGADANQYRKFIDYQEKQELIELEEKERHEAEKRDFLEKKRHKEREHNRVEIAGRAKKKRIQTIITISFIISALTAVLGYCVYNGWFASIFNRHLSIPDTVTTIADSEFAGKQLTSVVIPDSVTLIGNKSFSRNGLTSVNIPGSITSIGERAFWRNKLTILIIPNSVKSISENAFTSNRLTNITIGANVLLGNEVFGSGFEDFYNSNGMAAGTYIRPNTKSNAWNSWYDNYRFTNNNGNISILEYNGTDDTIEIPVEISGNPVTAIGEEVFKEKNLISVNIGNSVTSIGNGAFRQNRLNSVIIPNSVTEMGNEAFRENQLTSVTIGNSVISINNGTFHKNKLTSIVIPNSVTSIGESAFSENQLTSLNIGNSVSSILNNAFSQNKLASINIPSSVTSIGVNAFADNPITSVRIGANVKLAEEPGANGAGVLGYKTGFNGAYSSNGMRAGTYTRTSVNTTTWVRR